MVKKISVARRCTFQGCKRPESSSRFYQISGEGAAGGQDWSQLAGSVLCQACYKLFLTKGTLERAMHMSEPLAPPDRRCTFVGCSRPNKSTKFYQIDGSSSAGGQDWTSLAGSVLCDTCYNKFLKRGTLQKTNKRSSEEEMVSVPIGNSSIVLGGQGKRRRVKNEHEKRGKEQEKADSPPVIESKEDSTVLPKAGQGKAATDARRVSVESESFLAFKMEPPSTIAGSSRGHRDRRVLRVDVEPAAKKSSKRGACEGKRSPTEVDSRFVPSLQKWIPPSRVEGSTLQCDQGGERTSGRNEIPNPKRKQKGKKDDVDKEKWRLRDPRQLPECALCLADGIMVCIVPCGHNVCGVCGDKYVVGSGKKSPTMRCPLCRAEMCEPWIMDADVWVALGGEILDPAADDD